MTPKHTPIDEQEPEGEHAEVGHEKYDSVDR